MITSVQNNQVKQWRKLHNKKERMKTETFLIEGFHLIEEAWKSNWEIQEVIVQQGIEVPTWCQNRPTIETSESVFQHIAQTKTPQGIAAVVTMNNKATISGDRILLIDQVQDPGNLGTIIRTADAAGFSAIILGAGTVDVYNEKVIRATQGSLFHIPIIQANLLEKINELKGNGFTIWATALKNATVYNEAVVQEKTALILGNEGAGIQEDILHLADTVITIPIYGNAESLNVSVAAGILMYYLKT